MELTIQGHTYTFCEDVLAHKHTRDGYFKLADTIFGLKLEPWYRFGYWDHTFIPYVIYDGGIAVSSVAVCINEVLWENTRKRYVQISTVMTLLEYRGRGLNRWLMKHVLKEWNKKSDLIYLLGNDSVVNYYPKFGFEEFMEYDFTVPVQKLDGAFRNLKLSDRGDLDLLVRMYEASNPFAKFQVRNLSQFLFHCYNFHSDGIYYLEGLDAVAIAEHEGDKIRCYDILTNTDCPLHEVVGALAKENTKAACLGFTPKTTENCLVEGSTEEDNHLFVLSGKENLFKEHKILFPLLSRA